MKEIEERAAIVGVECEQIELDSGRKALAAVVKIMLPIPEQDERLLHKVEEMCEETAQQLKRIVFKQAIELADIELVMLKRGGKRGKGIQRIGKRDYTFKTIFGTVRV